MPKINTGQSWEQSYRLNARHIAKGVRISCNGRRKNIKGTQIFWVRYENNDDGSITRKSEYASSIYLPWKEEAVENNLKFIEETIKRSLNEPTKALKQHLLETLNQGIDDTPHLQKTDDPVLTELRLIRNYLEKLTLLQEMK